MRKVRTASGVTAVQVVSKSGGVRRIVKHLGSAHTEAGLEAGRQKIAVWQSQRMLDLESLELAPGRTGLVCATVASSARPCCGTFCTTHTPAWGARRFGGDRTFEQMVLGCLIESTTCKAQVLRVLGDLGLESVSVRTLFRSLGRCIERGYREAISAAVLKHAMVAGDVSLCLRASPRSTSRPRRRTSCARSR